MLYPFFTFKEIWEKDLKGWGIISFGDFYETSL